MKTLLSIVVFVFAVAAAQAMPLHQMRADWVVPAASGCGLGVHRGPYDGCYPIYGYFAGYDYRNSRGVCGGRGTHLACNSYGVCWIACN